MKGLESKIKSQRTKKRRIPRAKTNINSQKSKNRGHEPKPKEVTVRQSDAPWQVIYGRMRVGGVISFVHPHYDGLFLVITLAGHQIDSILNVYLNEDRINFGGTPDPRWALSGTRPDGTVNTGYFDRVFNAINIGATDQTAQPDLVTQSSLYFPGMWTADHRQRACAHTFMILRSSQEAFPDGLPDIAFEVAGKPLYDPRIPGYAYSNNAALVIADYLMDTRIGLGIPLEKIDIDRLIDAADVCDEVVPSILDANEKRYTIDMVFDVEETKQEVLEKMVTAIGGHITYVGGKWKIWPGEWRAPSITLTEDDLRGPVTIRTAVSKKDNFNAVKGTFVDSNNKWQITDFPIVKNDFYQAQDNDERVFKEMKFPATTTASKCQRLARLELEKIRQPLEVTASFGLKAFAVEVPQTVALTMPRYGWASKVFQVIESELIFDEGSDAPVITVELQLRETAEGVYSWSIDQETYVDLTPNSNLPSPFSSSAITGLTLESGTSQLYIRADGTVFSRIKVSWDSLSQDVVFSNGRIEIDYWQSASLLTPAPTDSFVNFATSVPASSTHAFILDVQDGVAYSVRVRAVNALNVGGPWSQVNNHLVVGKTAPPSNVQNFAGSINAFRINFSWDAVPDLDISHYEIRQSDSLLDWASAAFIAEVSATQYALNIQVTDTYYFLIKAVDTSGNYSTDATALVAAIGLPTAVQITHFVLGENIQLRWTESTGQFAIQDYEIRYGETFEASSFVARILGTALNIKGSWLNIRKFWVVAYDVAGNIGELASRDVQIYAPFVVNALTAQVIDNNVLLRWSAPSGGTLPIDHYDVRKGATFEGSELVGNVYGTFSALFEMVAGNYLYHVQGVDTAGNAGQVNQIAVNVDQPPDFELLADIELDPTDADTLANIRLELIPGAPEILPEPPLPGDPQVGVVIGVLAPYTY